MDSNRKHGKQQPNASLMLLLANQKVLRNGFSRSYLFFFFSVKERSRGQAKESVGKKKDNELLFSTFLLRKALQQVTGFLVIVSTTGTKVRVRMNPYCLISNFGFKTLRTSCLHFSIFGSSDNTGYERAAAVF